ncbi:ubiquitin conjugation factor E4 A-like [Corticium candelabrum]|uniref:ubiquitin conjugation factor E4 A-like n=1 Tax=Corticium candelabrum TaxID=121492 RepID=UPI002E2774A6|nr:ubiquitin conjugation factor E4 A-like [Corticium candelabrum]
MAEVKQNDFSLLFSSQADEEEAKRRCLELIRIEEDDMESFPQQMESQVVDLDEETDEEFEGEEMLRKAEIENELIERVFLITLEDEQVHWRRQFVLKGVHPACLVYLRLMAASETSDGLTGWLSEGNIDGAILERLHLSHPRLDVIWTRKKQTKRESQEEEAAEKIPLKYLAACYDRAVTEKRKHERSHELGCVEIAQHCANLAVSYAGMLLTNPELITLTEESLYDPAPVPKLDHYRDLFNLLMAVVGYRTVGTSSTAFFDDLVNRNKEDLNIIFTPVLKQFYEAVCQLSLHRPNDISSCFSVLHFITRHSSLARVFVSSDCWAPVSVSQIFGFSSQRLPVQGNAYEASTLIGRLAGLSCIPKPFRSSDFFLEPSQQGQAQMEATTASLRHQFTFVRDSLSRVLHELLRSTETRNDMLRWLVNCIRDNMGRRQLMAQSQLMFSNYSGDGFFLNLCAVLLKLCKPFLSSALNLKKLYSSYCSIQTDERREVDVVFLHAIKKETKLSVQPEGDLLVEEGDVTLMTQMFFITHRCLQLGLNRVCDHYKSLMQELIKVQQVVQDSLGGGQLLGPIREQFERSMTLQLSYKAQLLDPSFIEAVFQFYVATAQWLTHLALGEDIDVTKEDEYTVCIPETACVSLCHVPEFIVESLVEFFIFVRQFSETTLEIMGLDLHHLVTFTSVFMGNAQYVRNPHLRANMAEMIHMLLPRVESLNEGRSSVSSMARSKMFAKHWFAHSHLAKSMMRAFIDIEFTGHAMQFEQKFTYRHQMYYVFEYLWDLEPFKENIVKIADESVKESLRGQSGPLFIRFINMLLNDAIFLLDEAMEYLRKVKEGQRAQDQGEWADLPDAQRRERVSDFRLDEHMATANNVLSCKTVEALCYLTQEIQRPFVLPSMVDRVVAMLNYFLLLLVGPKMANLKVKNFDKYNFKPQLIVEKIVSIYVHLSCKIEFCAAIPCDGRSYSPTLFLQAKRVTQQIGKHELAAQLSELHEKLKYYDTKRQETEEAEANAPGEFLDPLTDELMKDPVELPSSRAVVDRSTIERHLLSDPTDPFNRSPLTIDMVVPDEELRQKIAKWREEAGIEKTTSS